MGKLVGKHEKMSHCEAKRILAGRGVDFGADFHALSTSDVQQIQLFTRYTGYRKRKDAPGSTSRMYFQLLVRAKCPLNGLGRAGRRRR
jgi:hypothetical protein